MTTDTLVILNAVAMAALLVLQTLGIVIGLVKMYRDGNAAHLKSQEMIERSNAILERIEKYRLVAVEKR